MTSKDNSEYDSETGTKRRFRTTIRYISVATAILLITEPVAAAAIDSVPCEVPESLQPLFTLLDSLTQLAFIAGVGLGLLGFSIAGLFFMIPGQEYNRRAKILAKNTLIGVIILLSADMVVGFLISQLGTAVCT